MTDETALLLNLLDRPSETGARLVYADWLEDDGQDDLAEWMRLHAGLPWFAPTDRRRRQHELRLRALREAHRRDCVEFGGLLLSWRSVLLVFSLRLAETVGWCTQRDSKVLRSPSFLPDLAGNASAIEPLWRCRRASARTALVHQLGNRRASELDRAGLAAEAPSGDLAGGKLLLFDPDAVPAEAAGGASSHGFLDRYRAPAWDAWIGYFDDGAEGHRRAHAHWEAEWIMNRRVVPVTYPSYLVAWVPPELVAAVDWHCNGHGHSGVAWAEHVDCDLSTRLRELGWFARKDAVKVEARHQQGFGFAWEPKIKRGLTRP
jgi:uncharacterized protein (TIGR02996 family)